MRCISNFPCSIWVAFLFETLNKLILIGQNIWNLPKFKCRDRNLQNYCNVAIKLPRFLMDIDNVASQYIVPHSFYAPQSKYSRDFKHQRHNYELEALQGDNYNCCTLCAKASATTVIPYAALASCTARRCISLFVQAFCSRLFIVLHSQPLLF